jgi:pimeloyl-[acyl-carrier protein] methyl ester esterase
MDVRLARKPNDALMGQNAPMTNAPAPAYDDLGFGGTPLVLLHGILADRSVFSDLLPEFSDRRVINVDLRGYGESPEADGYRTQDFVDDVVDLLGTLRTGPVDLLGWSMGGAIGTVLAAQSPALVHRLVLVDSTPCLVQRPDWEPAIPPADAQALGELLGRDWTAGAAAFAELVVSEPDQPEARARRS